MVESENDSLRERVRWLESELAGGAGFHPPFEWGLTFSEAQVLGVLVARPLATKSAMLAALYHSIGRDAAEEKIVDVFICKIRRKVTPYGVVIHTVWGQGYRLDPEWRARLQPHAQQAVAA